jgi:glycine C-acetyltransferase
MQPLVKTALLEELDRLRSQGLYRTLRRVDGEQGSSVAVDGKRRILLCSNNYLGLANHPALKKAASEALERFGCGSGASRLISGTMALHQDLEERVAAFKGTEAALIFNSGFQANTGIIPALVEREDAVFSDALNHASIIDGCRLSRAKVHIYRHCDPDHLGSLLQREAQARRKLIVTESVFSMDGDLAPLADIVSHAERYGALLMVDEAHATGLFGPHGAGLAQELGLQDGVDIQMGTFSKALGSFGAYVAGSKAMIELLVNRARPFIYSTSLPPPVLGASLAAVDLVEKDRSLRDSLWSNVRFAKQELASLGLGKEAAESPIFPIVIGDPEKTLQAATALDERGVFVQAIRPPTVPAGTSRLRLTVMATHSRQELQTALIALSEVLRLSGPKDG